MRIAWRRRSVATVLVVASIGFARSSAQAPTTPPPQVIQGRDGGTSGRMESLFVPPLAGAPFTMTLATEWSRPLASGGSFTLVNRRMIARDGRGRIYQERRLLTPKGGKTDFYMDVFQITDPAQRSWLNCGTRSKVCQIFTYGLTPDMVYQPAVGTTGALPGNRGSHLHEDLGRSRTEGVDTQGYRETTTINAGVMGNDRPMVVTREFWYAAQLGINMISVVDDPQNGKQVFTVTNLTTLEPDPKVFEVPEGYKVIDRRNTVEDPNSDRK